MNESALLFKVSRVFCIGIALVVLLTVARSPAQSKAEVFVPDEVLVKFKAGRSTQARTRSIRQLNASLVEQLGDGAWVRVKIAKGQSVESTINSFARMGDVEAVQPNFYYRITATPNDTFWSDLYGMVKIGAPVAWNTRTDCSSVVVADIDTGLDYTHEDLAANTWVNAGEIPGNSVDDDGNGFVDDYHGYDFRFNDSDPMDENGHGTHTAGTIGAIGNNSMGVAGVCWNVKIMGIKIYSAGAADSTSAMVINAYNYVTMMKQRGVNIRVTNNSYGDCPETCGYDQALKDAIDAAGEAGILNVFSAGNAGRNNDLTPFYPASYTSPSILAVGGSDSNDARVFNFGPDSVDLAAPGVSILSTVPAALNPAKYRLLSGASMSTPHVSGSAALLIAQDPTLSAASVKARLMNSVDVLPAFTGAFKSNGRLNLAAALQNQTVCTFDLGSNSVDVPTKGGEFTVNVTAAPNCDFAVKRSVNWISIVGPDSLSGNSTVGFRVRISPTISRSGMITIAGQTFTINQSKPH